MANGAITREQFDKLINEGFTVEEIVSFEKRYQQQQNLKSPQSTPQQSQPIQQPQGMERQNILGQLFNVPGAAVRSAIQGKGYTQGAINPSQVPTFQKLALDKYYTNLAKSGKNPSILDVLAGNSVSAIGMAADMITNPADMLLALVGSKAVKAKFLKKSIKSPKMPKIDSTLVQSKKTQIALKEIKKTLGTAKRLAIQEVENLPTDKVKLTSPRAVRYLKDSQNVYGAVVDDTGNVAPRLGNLDKVKEALGDMIGSKPQAWLDMGRKEKQAIYSSYRELRSAIIKASKSAGKDVTKYLDDYHKFMMNYNQIWKTVSDVQGQAVANKLRKAFQWKAEPAVKEAWKEVSKLSPEIRRVMKSQQNRRLLKNLLIGGAVTLGYTKGKQIITAIP